MMPPTSLDPLPGFVSRQVIDARRFFLNLNPDCGSAWEVVCGGVERMSPDYLVQRTDFPYFAIELVAEGEGTVTLGNAQTALSAGSVFAYGPGFAHVIANQPDRPMRKYYFDFVGTRARPLLQESGLLVGTNDYRVISVGAVVELVELFEMFLRDAREESPVARSICSAIGQLLLLKIKQKRLADGREVSPAYATYDRIRIHIDEHFETLWTATEVAKQCDVSPVYLSRLFRRYANCGAYDFLLRRKMNVAAGLLMNEGLRVKDVSRRIGFADPFQFSRAFKRVYGVAPRELMAAKRSASE